MALQSVLSGIVDTTSSTGASEHADFSGSSQFRSHPLSKPRAFTAVKHHIDDGGYDSSLELLSAVKTLPSSPINRVDIVDAINAIYGDQDLWPPILSSQTTLRIQLKKESSYSSNIDFDFNADKVMEMLMCHPSYCNVELEDIVPAMREYVCTVLYSSYRTYVGYESRGPTDI